MSEDAVGPPRSLERAGVVLACLTTVLLAGGGEQPRAATQGTDRLTAFEHHQALTRSSPFSNLTWQFLGPTNISGRVNDVAVADRGGHRRIYLAFSGSGLWASDDNATTWQPVFTNAAVTAVNAVAVAPSDPSIVWILTGTSRSHIPLASAGVFKSTDAGKTWQHMGLSDVGEGGIGKIVIHPRTPDTVYVAAAGGPDKVRNVRGLFKTTNGGKTWSRILDRGVNTAAGSVAVDPSDPETLYVTTQQRARGNEVALWASYPDETRFSVFRSRDGGATWTEIVNGLPEGKVRFGISLEISQSHPNVLYSVVDVRDKLPPSAAQPSLRIYRSDDRGDTWRQVNRSDDSPLESWLKGIRIDPRDDQTIVVFGVRLYVSHDGGRTFRRVDGPHNDHNEFWFDPKHAGLAYDCSDGGFYIHEDVGEAWTLASAPATSQVYDVALDMATPFHVYSAVHDQLSFRGTVDLSAGRDRVPPASFERGPGEEVTSHAIDPDRRYVFAGTAYNGRTVTRFDSSSVTALPRLISTTITPKVDAGEPPLHGAWFLPLLLSPFDTKTINTGYQYVYRSRDSGTTWERISPDVTGGGPAERRNPDYSNLSVQTIAESPRQRGVIYAGTDDGHLHVTRDDGKSWMELTKNLPHHV